MATESSRRVAVAARFVQRLFAIMLLVAAAACEAAAQEPNIVSGTVRTADGRPVAGATIRVSGSTGAARGTTVRTKSDRTGSYRVEVRPGHYDVDAFYDLEFDGQIYREFWLDRTNDGCERSNVSTRPAVATLPGGTRRGAMLARGGGRLGQTAWLHDIPPARYVVSAPDAMKDFCRRRFPNEYAEVARYIEEYPDTLVMDFENVLAGTEKHGHEYLLQAARHRGFSSVEHKGFVTCLVIIQAMRSHEFMSAMVAATSAAGMEKWEYFWMLKHAWADRVALARAATPCGAGRWTLYRTERHRFPLCDSPVMINRDNVMMTLSPRLLAEIDLAVHTPEDKWTVRDGISSSKYREFRRRSIQNTFKDVIFSDAAELETWKALPEFRGRMRDLSTRQREHHAQKLGAHRIMWALSGFGRVPDDFEHWIEAIMDTSAKRGMEHT